MADQLCMKWNNYSLAFSNYSKKLYLKDTFSDGTVFCDGRFYPIHRFVLSTCSEYFEEIFEKSLHISNKETFIIIKDIAAEQMDALVNYMYTGEVSVAQEDLPPLLKAAEALKIRGLVIPNSEDIIDPKSKKRSKSPEFVSSSAKKTKRTEEFAEPNSPLESIMADPFPYNPPSGVLNDIKNEPFDLEAIEIDEEESLVIEEFKESIFGENFVDQISNIDSHLNDSLDNIDKSVMDDDYQMEQDDLSAKDSNDDDYINHRNISDQGFQNSSKKLLTTFGIPQSKLDQHPKLKYAIKSGKYLTKSAKGLLLEVILGELKEQSQCNNVGMKSAGAYVFNEFRHLFKNADSKSPNSFIRYYTKGLSDKKFYEKRKIQLLESPNEEVEENSEFSCRYGYMNYVPNKELNRAVYEDTIQKMKDPTTSPEKKMRMMETTFPIRRQIVTANSTTTEYVQETFPLLFTTKQFMIEANLLVGSKALNTNLETRLRAFINGKLPEEMFEIKSSKYLKFLQQLCIGHEKMTNYQTKKELSMLGEVAILLHEDPRLIFGYERSAVQTGYPFLLLSSNKDTADLIFNGSTVIRDLKAIHMAVIWGVSFPVLHIKVPRKVKKTYEFILRATLGWKDYAVKNCNSTAVESLLNAFNSSS